MVDEIANGLTRPDVAAALASTAFASLARAGAPLMAAEGDPARVIYANRAALALFGVVDCAGLNDRLSASDELARQFRRLAQSLLPGAAPRLERLCLFLDSLPETVTFLCRRTPGANPLLVIVGLGRRAGAPRTQPPAFEPAPAAVETSSAEAPALPPQAQPPQAQAEPAGNRQAGSFSAFKTEMARRFPGLAPARFLWRTDAANIVTEMTPPLSEIVGAGCADLVGRDFGEAVKALGLDPRGELAEALTARTTFSRIDLDWPVENVAAVTPVSLGALPAFDRRQGFEGWRGFGVIHLNALREAPLFAAPFVAPLAAKPAAAEPEAPPAAAAPQEFTGVVVPLRPNVAWPAAPQTEAPAAPQEIELQPDELKKWQNPRGNSREPDEDSVLVSLAPHERHAFREIARKLGARIEESGPAAADPELTRDQQPSHAEPKRSEPSAPGPAFSPAFADALPFGLAVTRGDLALFANRRLLDWLGFADFGAFSQAGGLGGACKGGPPDFGKSERRTLLLRPRGGETFAVDAHRAPMLWDGAPADCLTLSRPSALALQQRVGVLETGLRQREAEVDEILTILETAGDGFILVNTDGLILGLNRPAESLFGYGRNEIAGEKFTHLLDRSSQAAALDLFARLKAGERKGAAEMTGRTRQGGEFQLQLIFGWLGAASNGKYCAVLRDMSPWKKAEIALEEARDQAQRASQAKSELLAKVSHEIRTPLNAILGFAEVIVEERFGPIGNERYKDYLKDIHTSGAHVMSLANDLLDLSKIEAGKMNLVFAAVDANRIVGECVSLIQPQANRERVITRLALAPRLPAVFADERSLRQIVLNLLANAVRYNEPGGQVIVSTALGDSGQAVLRVKDTGVGMSESELVTALEPFGQVAPTRAFGGAGLGLPLTKALAEANHAAFTIRSRKSEGTLVEVSFPLAPDSAEVASVAGRAG